jgi:hypothetical protein
LILDPQTESEELFVASLKADPNNTVALVGYGRLLSQMMDLEKANVMYQTACEVLGDGIVGGEDRSEVMSSWALGFWSWGKGLWVLRFHELCRNSCALLEFMPFIGVH